MEQLRHLLQRIDRKGYKAYKEITGTYRGDGFLLHIDHVQADPFAEPSRLRVEVLPRLIQAEPEWINTAWRRIACQEFLARRAAEELRKTGQRPTGHGNSGLIAIDRPGQEMLQRTAVVVEENRIEFRLSAGLPAAGRTVLGQEAIRLLCKTVPAIVKQALIPLDRERLREYLELSDQQQAIRSYLREHGFVAFVANGSILPRESGVSDRPMRGPEVVPFRSPASLEIEIPLPHRSPIRGMGIPRGVTLIVGGGYHGKSTLLKAIERGVYNHIPGDGREYVITDDSACKIRAEDGRRVEAVDISPFITHLPFGKDTRRFSTEDASGSTSQAANIMEALEMGAKVLLIDEDTSATNFMIRDARMQRLVAKEKEPITPFVDKVRQLYEQLHVSTILVLGGSGDYFHAADTVIMLDEYRPADVTEKAREIAAQFDSGRIPEGGDRFGRIAPRIVLPGSLDASRGRKEKAAARGLASIVFGTNEIDLSYVEQLVDPSQTRALARMLAYMADSLIDGKTSLAGMIDQLYERIERQGLELISPYRGKHPGDLALPRKFELAAAVNRLRSLRMKG
jgi:predicted ABC-class ATPase